jgi:hypothetical protein
MVDHTLIVTFDYEVDGKPVVHWWPVTTRERSRLYRRFESAGRGELFEETDFYEIEVNRARRRVWINPERVVEARLAFDLPFDATSPSTMEKSEEDREWMEEEGVPMDLYPFAIVGWTRAPWCGRGSQLELSDQNPDDILGIQNQFEFYNGERFVHVSDDDADVLFLPRDDVAFVDLVDLHYDEDLNPIGFKPEKRPDQGEGPGSDLDRDGLAG